MDVVVQDASNSSRRVLLRIAARSTIADARKVLAVLLHQPAAEVRFVMLVGNLLANHVDHEEVCLRHSAADFRRANGGICRRLLVQLREGVELVLPPPSSPWPPCAGGCAAAAGGGAAGGPWVDDDEWILV